ncbi:MAG: acetyl-CoA carboxylase carboxyltransferase subunit alpha [bacterium]|nr:acetyl-CoA carboxylase carboxyltransferase subunit alpha [bacterium]
MNGLDFEKPILELESKLEELRHLSSSGELNITDEVSRLEVKRDKLLQQAYSKLTPWQKVQVARHQDRPHFSDYVKHLIEDFTELSGDRLFAEDAAIIGGLGRFRGRSVVVLGQEKGRDMETRLKHNFGMPRPEGYRKAQRLMKMAEKFQLPLVTFIDTAGAHPGVDAEERGQSEAIAKSIEMAASLTVPVVAIVTGEGMSGGAIAIGVANHIYMLEHSIYAVISPEGCASILWRTGEKKQEAAAVQKLTAQDLKKFKIIEGIIPEPLGGAHRDKHAVMNGVSKTLDKALSQLSSLSGDQILKQRRDKFLAMGRTL